MDVKPRFKTSDVGEIPQEWSAETLGRLVERLSNGFGYTKSAVSDFPVTRIETISDGVINFERVGYAKREANIEKFRLQAGDILFSHINSLDHIGKVALYDGLIPLYHGMNLLLLRPGARINAKYLYYWLSSLPGRRTSTLLARQAVSQASINTADLRAVSVPLPPTRSEQDAIAEALSDADAYIESLEQLLAKKLKIKLGAMQELLTGKRRLPGFEVKQGVKSSEVGVIPEDWNVHSLSDISDLKNGYAFESNTYSELGVFNVITISNVQDGYMDGIASCNRVSVLPRDLQQHQRLAAGDILISMTGNVGRMCRVSESNCLLNQRVGKLLPKGVDPTYLFLLLSQPTFQGQMSERATGGAQDNLSKSDILGYRFASPSKRAEQIAIAAVLSDINDEAAEIQAKLVKARCIKQGMMQQLFTGKIRLV